MAFFLRFWSGPAWRPSQETAARRRTEEDQEQQEPDNPGLPQEPEDDEDDGGMALDDGGVAAGGVADAEAGGEEGGETDNGDRTEATDAGDRTAAAPTAAAPTAAGTHGNEDQDFGHHEDTEDEDDNRGEDDSQPTDQTSSNSSTRSTSSTDLRDLPEEELRSIQKARSKRAGKRKAEGAKFWNEKTRTNATKKRYLATLSTQIGEIKKVKKELKKCVPTEAVKEELEALEEELEHCQREKRRASGSGYTTLSTIKNEPGFGTFVPENHPPPKPYTKEENRFRRDGFQLLNHACYTCLRSTKNNCVKDTFNMATGEAEPEYMKEEDLYNAHAKSCNGDKEFVKTVSLGALALQDLCHGRYRAFNVFEETQDTLGFKEKIRNFATLFAQNRGIFVVEVNTPHGIGHALVYNARAGLLLDSNIDRALVIERRDQKMRERIGGTEDLAKMLFDDFRYLDITNVVVMCVSNRAIRSNAVPHHIRNVPSSSKKAKPASSAKKRPADPPEPSKKKNGKLSKKAKTGPSTKKRPADPPEPSKKNKGKRRKKSQSK